MKSSEYVENLSKQVEYVHEYARTKLKKTSLQQMGNQRAYYESFQ